MMINELKLICTDRNSHPSRQLALFQFSPDLINGFAIWDGNADQSIHPMDTVKESVRVTKKGPNKVTERAPVKRISRADGGVTFQLPVCPTCNRDIRLRDETLSKLLRILCDTPPVSTFDVSLLPM